MILAQLLADATAERGAVFNDPMIVAGTALPQHHRRAIAGASMRQLELMI